MNKRLNNVNLWLFFFIELTLIYVYSVNRIMIVLLYWSVRKDVKAFGNVWLFVTLSFLFYIPVVIGAEAVPLLGMFMLPKTVCYVLILLAFKKQSEMEN